MPPFNPDALKPYAVPWLLPNVGNWSSVWRYTVCDRPRKERRIS